MLTLVSTLDSIVVIDQSAFTTEYKEREPVRVKMLKKYPFFLRIEITYTKGEVKIEFSGKVLGKRYPELISRNTIRECFQRINDLGFCEIDIEKMMKAQVMKCDVTKDVPIRDVPSLNRFLRGHIRNYQSYSCKPHKITGNLDIFKNVDGADYQRWLTIYDKQKEMNRAQEQRFSEENDLTGEFDGKCRFELKLTSQQAIRDALQITGTTLAEVLCSECNPIQDFLNDVIQEDTTANVQDTWKTYWQALVLEDCNYDLAQVEAKLRKYKGGGIAKAMKPFKELMAANPSDFSEWSKAKILDALK